MGLARRIAPMLIHHMAAQAGQAVSAVNARVLTPELMDDPGLEPGLHHDALHGLARINRFSTSVGSITRETLRLYESAPPTLTDRPLRVLDVACGGGDVTRRCADQLQRRGLNAEWTGLDVSPVAIEHARVQTRDRSNVSYTLHDALQTPLPSGHDVVICSLFLHHLDRASCVSLLRAMHEASTLGVVINDLRRTRLGYTMAWCGTRLLSRSPIVHYDGPASVRAAWTDSELTGIAKEAGLNEPCVTYHFPQRMTLGWRRSP